MAYTPDKSKIVNRALSLLGSTTRIVSLEDDSGPVAEQARAHWGDLVEALFAEHPWNPFIERALLNESSGKPAYGYERMFALPPDCLRILPSDPRGNIDPLPGEIEGGYILTDKESLEVRFISKAKVDNIPDWPAHVRLAMAALLARELAEAVTGSAELEGGAQSRVDAALSDAKRIDGQQSANINRGFVTRKSNWLQGMRRTYNYWGR